MTRINKPIIIFTSFLIFSACTPIYENGRNNQLPDNSSINSFADCIQAGYPIMESYPRQCRTPDGRTFIDRLNSNELISVSSPTPQSTISSPLTIEGQARGPWYFEASFPVKLIDQNNNILGQTLAWAQGEWTTSEFVPFKAEMTFQLTNATSGFLVLEKSNPSGLPEMAGELRIPLNISPSENVIQRDIQLFYYNQEKDRDTSGNILCSQQGLVALNRKIPLTLSPIRDAIQLLIRGELSQEEKNQGITTEFPLNGLELKSANLKEGQLILEFSDPNNSTSGGSCRVNILRTQIEATAKQFPEVREVKIIPEELFQP